MHAFSIFPSLGLQVQSSRKGESPCEEIFAKNPLYVLLILLTNQVVIYNETHLSPTSTISFETSEPL